MEQTLALELLRKLICILFVSIFAYSQRDNEYYYPFSIELINNSVPLTYGSNAAVAYQFIPHRLSLLIRLVCKLIDALENCFSYSTI